MSKSVCELLLEFYPKISEFEDLQSTYVANCVFNSLLCYSAIMLNVVTIHAIRKTSSLPKTLNTLLLSLAVSDVGVGLLGQPIYISLLAMWLQQNDPGCNRYKAFFIIWELFSLASFLGVLAVSVDRFLAIHLHLRYQELVTHKRVVAVVIFIWVLSVFLSLMVLFVSLYVNGIFVLVLGALCLPVVIGVNIRIYLVARRHKNEIAQLRFPQPEEMANLANVVKSAVGILYVFLLFLICYLPAFIAITVYQIYGPSIPLKRAHLYSWTLFNLNSSLNPLIYCWKMTHIRHAILNMLRNMSWLRNDASN